MSRKRHKNPVWWPGMYEGKNAEDVKRQVGTAVMRSVSGDKTPASMRGFNPKTGALRGDGKLCMPINGL